MIQHSRLAVHTGHDRRDADEDDGVAQDHVASLPCDVIARAAPVHEPPLHSLHRHGARPQEPPRLARALVRQPLNLVVLDEVDAAQDVHGDGHEAHEHEHVAFEEDRTRHATYGSRVAARRRAVLAEQVHAHDRREAAHEYRYQEVLGLLGAHHIRTRLKHKYCYTVRHPEERLRGHHGDLCALAAARFRNDGLPRHMHSAMAVQRPGRL